MQPNKKAFTLIELLIVVAIIAILAAIAVPNFLEAQTRSKVSRVKADMRSIAVGLESYYVDSGQYPYYPFTGTNNQPTQEDLDSGFCGLTPSTLTTPIAYLTSLPSDAFEFGSNFYDGALEVPNPQNLFNYDWEKAANARFGGNPYWGELISNTFKWTLVSVGPDRVAIINGPNGLHENLAEYYSLPALSANGKGPDWHYDPTNGTVSVGDIVYTGPGGPFGYINTKNLQPL